MKLTMKNDYSFQKSIGYLDDPKMMSTDDVKTELERWAYAIGSWMEGVEPDPEEIAGLDGFLFDLASSDVEYREPLHKFDYTVVFEYSVPMSVIAKDEHEATMLAIEKLKKNERTLEATKRWANTLIYTDDGDEIYDKFNS